MDSKKTNFIGKCHCPECNGLYMIIDNKIISCPVCELNSHGNISKMDEEEAGKEVVQ